MRARAAFLIMALALATSPSEAATFLSVAGVWSSTVPTDNRSDTGYSGKPSLGAGLLLAFPVWRRFELETGALFIGRKYSNTGASSNTVQQRLLQVPMVVRLPFLGYFSIGGGLYYSFFQGQIENSFRSGASTVTTEQSYAAENRSTSELGVLGSLGFVTAPIGQLRLFADFRYVYGFTDTDLTATSLTFDDAMILIGIRIPLWRRE
jgi:hypothetical protein